MSIRVTLLQIFVGRWSNFHIVRRFCLFFPFSDFRRAHFGSSRQFGSNNWLYRRLPICYSITDSCSVKWKICLFTYWLKFRWKLYKIILSHSWFHLCYLLIYSFKIMSPVLCYYIFSSLTNWSLFIRIWTDPAILCWSKLYY